MYPNGEQQITEYLIRTEVLFICGKCGHTVVMNVPVQEDENTRSYCCSATYKVKRYSDGDFSIFRVADQIEKIVELDRAAQDTEKR